MNDISAACTPDCQGSESVSGANRCYGFGPDSCCQVYVDGMCAEACPEDGVYLIDDDFDCCKHLQLIFCSKLINYSFTYMFFSEELSWSWHGGEWRGDIHSTWHK